MLINSVLIGPHSSGTPLLQVYSPPQQAYSQAREKAPDQSQRPFDFPQCREILSYLWWDGRCSTQLCRKDTGNQKIHFVL